MGKARYLATYDETTPGTFPASPTAEYWRLIGDDAFLMKPAPQFYDVRTAEATNRLIEQVSTRVVMKGKLNTYFYPEQAGALLGWALDLNGSQELSSKSFQYHDGVVYQQGLGNYVEQLVLSCAAEQEEGLIKASVDLVGIKPGAAITGTDLPAPDLASDFPTLPCYRLIDSKGALVLIDTGSTALTKYNSWTLTIKNILSPNFDEDKYVSDVTWHGREITFEANIRHISSAHRGFFEAQTPMKVSLVMTKGTTPSAHTLTVNMQGNNRINTLDLSQPLAKPNYQKMMLKNIIDRATGDDITYGDVVA